MVLSLQDSGRHHCSSEHRYCTLCYGSRIRRYLEAAAYRSGIYSFLAYHVCHHEQHRILVSSFTHPISSQQIELRRSTVGTNISDFSRFLKNPRNVWTQCFWFPFICVWIGVLGIIGTSASKQLYGEYIWDPIAISANWTSPGGRAAAFFCGFAWCVAQIGVNLSANVISCAHDLTSFFPKYLNLRRSAVIITITGGW